MKIVTAPSLLILLSVTATGALAQEPSLVVVCERGSIEGSRTEIDENGYAIMGDRADLASIVYAFDVPERGMVRISLGTEELVEPILNEYATYKTVAYTFGGVSYMDTVFFELGKVLSSEHKDLFRVVIATTWRFDCVVEGQSSRDTICTSPLPLAPSMALAGMARGGDSMHLDSRYANVRFWSKADVG